MTENQIELPAEVVSEYYDNDSARVIFAPPAGVPSTGWADWAREVFPLPVATVERLSEGGRLLLAVTLGESDEGEARTPKTFRLVPPVSHNHAKALPIVSVNLNGVSDWVPPPTLQQPPPPRDTCERPVRVRAGTHARIRKLSKRLGLGIADTIDKAVEAMING